MTAYTPSTPRSNSSLAVPALDNQISADLVAADPSIFSMLPTASDVDLASYGTLLLHGPPGSGKTSSVYMCCLGLGYRVIEINPSVRRTGKAVLHLFKEATQSYALIMRDPLTAGDIWKTVPDCPAGTSAKRSQACGTAPEPASTAKRSRREPKALTSKQESPPTVVKPSGLLAFFGSKGGPGTGQGARTGTSMPTPNGPAAKQNGAVKGAEGEVKSSAVKAAHAVNFFEPKAPAARSAAKHEGAKRQREEENEAALQGSASSKLKVAKQDAKQWEGQEVPATGRVNRQKLEGETSVECPAAQWCDLGAWTEKPDPGIQDNTVILFDDADVVFADEPGFLTALKQLIDDNKCPVIVTCTQPIPELAADDNVFPVAFDGFAPSPPVTLPMLPTTIQWAGSDSSCDSDAKASVPPDAPTLPAENPVISRKSSRKGTAANPIAISTPEKAPPTPPSLPLAPTTTSPCCRFLFGAPLHLQVLMACHGVDLRLDEAEELLRFHRFDLRQVLLSLQLWLRCPPPLPLPSAPMATLHTVRLVDGLLPDLLGLQAWQRWWETLTTDATEATGPQTCPVCTAGGGLSRFRDTTVDQLVQALGQQPHGTACHGWDVIFHNYLSLLPDALHDFFAALPPGPHAAPRSAKHSEAAVEEVPPMSPAPAVEQPSTAVNVEDEPQAPALMPQQESVDTASVTELPAVAPMQMALDDSASSSNGGSFTDHQDGESSGNLPLEGGSVDALIRAMATRQRQEVEARARAKKATFWGPRAQGKGAAPKEELIEVSAVAVTGPPAVAVAESQEEPPTALAVAEVPHGRPKRERRHPDRFVVSPTRSRGSKPNRPAAPPLSPAGVDLPTLDPDQARFACDALDSLAEMAACLSACDVLYRSVACPSRMANTPSHWMADVHTSSLASLEEECNGAVEWASEQQEYGLGVSYPFPFVTAEVSAGTKALLRLRERIASTSAALPQPSCCSAVATGTDPLTPTDVPSPPQVTDVGPPPTESQPAAAASSSSVDPAEALHRSGSRMAVTALPVAERIRHIPSSSCAGALTFDRCRAKLVNLSAGGGPRRSPTVTNWGGMALVWETDEGLVPLIRIAPGLLLCHCRPWLTPTCATAQGAALKRAVPDLVPYWTWGAGRLCTEVVPFMAAICQLEALREKRGRRKSKFRHHFDHLEEDALHLLMAYGLVAPKCTASGHRLH
eukprot:GGOE01002092.1.p1 GENE.GGOE01002092.1~~GGOE01002092.1.p1  ORF type:complete len:1328 (-),score=317.75 GGOE01002092.1:293-3871(-)